MKNRVVTLLALIFLNASGQNKQIDFLLSELKKQKNDSTRVTTYNKISREFYLHGNYSDAKDYAEKAKNLGDKLNYKKGIATAYKNIGNIYIDQGDYPEALQNELSALKIWRELNNNHEVANTYSNIGSVYNYQGDYTKALDYYFKALKIYEEANLQKSISYVNTLNNVGVIYEAQGQTSGALQKYFDALKIYEEIDDKLGVATSLNNIGNIYKGYKNGDTKAIEYYLKALAIREQIDDKYGVSTSLQNIGIIYFNQKNYSKALKYFNSSLLAAKEIDALDLIANAESDLSNVYEALHDNTNAFIHYKAYVDARDSLSNIDNIKKVSEQEFKMKEDELKAEQARKEVIHKAEQIKNEAELKRQKVIGYAFTIGFLLVLVLIAVVFRSLQLTRKKNKIIEIQKAEVEHKQKEIVDSITSAQRIQQALLASEAMLKDNLPEYFVFFKPKDIVSGDFYWAIHAHNRFYLVTADSTGHGVPGAFMSLLNISFLNEAISEKHLESPDEILNHTRSRLISSLKSDGSLEGGKDGMDCIVAAFDFSRNVLQYAAANNSFYIVRKGQLITCKADKMPVGKSPKDGEPFRSWTIPLQKGDVVYTITDGYADQFGGPKGKKFKYKPFEEMLLSNSHLSMSAQKRLLAESFETWKGDLEQIDDVLVIGIKI